MKIAMNVLLAATLLLSVPIANAKTPAYLKKGMVITCPLTHENAYKVVKTVREGYLVSHKDIVFYGTNKHPKRFEPPKCDSIVTIFTGACVHTNKGWLPERCQKLLQISFTTRAVIQ